MTAALYELGSVWL